MTDVTSAKSFVKLYLDPVLLKRCNLDSLVIDTGSYVDNDLRERFSDVLYKLDFKDNSSCIYVYIMVEHQSSAQKLMPLRILRYQLEIIQKHVDKYKIEGDLPLVVPLVFYNGVDSPYPHATDINILFAGGDLINKVGLGKFSLVDLTIKPESEILQHKQLALLEMCLKHIYVRDFNKVVGHVFNAFKVAHEHELSKKLFDSTLSYLMKAKEYEELQPLFTELTENFEDYKEDIMSYAESLKLEGKLEGIQQGKLEGIQQGMQRGMQQGMQQGKLEMVQEMLKAGVELPLIEKVSHLSKKEIEKIKKTIH